MIAGIATQQSEAPRALAAQTDRNKLLSALLVAVKSIGILGGAKATTATGGSATLPSAPAGFWTVTFPDGTTGKFPYYNT